MEPTRQKYRYEPLIGKRETRVLHLQSGWGNGELFGTLERIDLAHKTDYEAISYEWGEPDRTHCIIVDGCVLGIAESLFYALRDIRHESSDKDRVVWADAISINQDDLAERESQVAFMGSIYSHASRVITYTGPEIDGCSSAIELANQLVLSDHEFRLFHQDAFEALSEVQSKQKGFSLLMSAPWTSLKQMLLRGWAGRCWCAQEFLLNKELVVMYGRVELPHWALITRVADMLLREPAPGWADHFDLLPHEPAHIYECLQSLHHLRLQIVDRSAPETLFGLLWMSHPFLASDPRGMYQISKQS
jgi:Heterokaryon incompatibility protein (HET)